MGLGDIDKVDLIVTEYNHFAEFIRQTSLADEETEAIGHVATPATVRGLVVVGQLPAKKAAAASKIVEIPIDFHPASDDSDLPEDPSDWLESDWASVAGEPVVYSVSRSKLEGEFSVGKIEDSSKRTTTEKTDQTEQQTDENGNSPIITPETFDEIED